MRPVVTFIIPTVGRDSLERALGSLQAQSLDDWNALVVSDGVEGSRLDLARKFHGDDRIHWFATPERVGSAGLARNFGLEIMAGLDDRGLWVGFLDDDDTLEPEYVQELNDIYAYAGEQIQCVVFRMDHPMLGILPDPDEPRIEWGHVGISFAVQWWLVEREGLRFIREQNLAVGGPGNNEDINFLLQTIKAIPRDPREDDVVPDEGYTHPPGAPWGLYVHPQVMYHCRLGGDWT